MNLANRGVYNFGIGFEPWSISRVPVNATLFGGGAQIGASTKVGFKSSANARLVSNTAIVSHSGIKAL